MTRDHKEFQQQTGHPQVFRRVGSGFVEAKTNARRRRQKNQTIKKVRMMPSAKTLAAHAGD